MKPNPYPATPVGSNPVSTRASAAVAGTVASQTLLMSPPQVERSAATMTPVEQFTAGTAPAGGADNAGPSPPHQPTPAAPAATAASNGARILAGRRRSRNT